VRACERALERVRGQRDNCRERELEDREGVCVRRQRRRWSRRDIVWIEGSMKEERMRTEEKGIRTEEGRVG
jgi:hypothetical protein